ncbi:MAG TPA: DMT family transporter [Acidimicrobiia bacterium]|nr:DMT family transporter [Acidimicrobiia bacterium]
MRSVTRLVWQEPSATGPRQPTRVAIYVLLVVVTLILGLNWPVMATGVVSISPVWMGVFRVTGALIVIVPITIFSGNLVMPRRPDLPILVSLAVFRLTLVFLLLFSGLELVPPGRSSAIVWTASLWTVPIAAVFLGEHMATRRWVGLTLGIVGVVILFEPWAMAWDDPGVALGHLLLMLAAITNAATAVHIRGHRWSMSPLQAIPWQLGGAFLMLTVIALAREGIPLIDWTPQLGLVVAYQGVLATGFAFWAQITILRNMAAVSANLTLMAVPVVGVLSSALLVGEPITATLILGLVLIISGVSVNLLSDGVDVSAAPVPDRIQFDEDF